MHDDPFLFSNKSLPSLVLCILSRSKKISEREKLKFYCNFYSNTIEFFYELQVYMPYNYPPARLILPEETILPAKNVLYRPICDEINKSG